MDSWIKKSNILTQHFNNLIFRLVLTFSYSGHVHTYTGNFINKVFPFSIFKQISVHMKTQKHAMKHCQEHAKPTGGDIISTIKPCWPIRSLKKFPVGGDNSACSDITSQNICLIQMITLQLEFLKIFTLAAVFKNVWFQWPGAAFACGCMAKPHRKIHSFMWTRPQGHDTRNKTDLMAKSLRHVKANKSDLKSLHMIILF